MTLRLHASWALLMTCVATGCDRLPAFATFPDAGTLAVTLCPKEPSADVQAKAHELLAAAILKADSRQSVTAQLHLTINQFGQQMVGSGSYLEQGYATMRQARCDASFQLGGRAATLLDVCDGRNIWFLRECGNDRVLSWIDLTRVSASLAISPSPPADGIMGIWSRALGFGKTLRRMDEGFRFHAVESAELGQTPMWRLTGVWTSETLGRIVPAQKERLTQGKSPDYAAIGPQVPDHLVLYLGKEDLFPFRWEFHRCYSHGMPRTPLTPRGSDSLLFAVQWSRVTFNQPLDPVYFTYNPGGVKPDDLTLPIIHHYGLKEPPPAE